MNHTITGAVLLSVTFFGLTPTIFAQSFGIVRDSTTNEPVPFVNIWVEGESVGTTANEKGEFRFEESMTGKTIVLSSIGYKTRAITLEENPAAIFLPPDIIHLKEVVVTRRKEKIRTVGQKMKTSKVRLFFYCGGMPYMKARFFPYMPEFAETPFLSKVDVVTTSRLDSAVFNLRFYTMDSDGKPGKPIYDENIFVSVKKGRNLTSVDVSDKAIEFPLTGLLVVFEYLIIDQNAFVFPHVVPPDTVMLPKTAYAPAVGTLPSEEGENNWFYRNGAWMQEERNTWIKDKDYRDKYEKLAVKVTLTN